MKVTITPSGVSRILALVVVFLILAGLAAQIFEAVWGPEGLVRFALLFDVVKERTIPTWYSSFALLLCSVLLATIAVAKRRYGDRYALHWGGLSAIFLFLAVDEATLIHETTGEVVSSLVGSFGLVPGGLIPYFRIIPMAIFVLIVLLWYLRFLIHLPQRTLVLFLLAGTLFVAGALGVEIMELRRMFSVEGSTIPYETRIWLAVQRTIEEGLEMSSIVLFIYALLSYMGSYVKEVTLQVSSDTQAKL
jgi:hypothetical protein